MHGPSMPFLWAQVELSRLLEHHKHFQKLYEMLKREYEFIPDDLANLKCKVR